MNKIWLKYPPKIVWANNPILFLNWYIQFQENQGDILISIDFNGKRMGLYNQMHISKTEGIVGRCVRVTVVSQMWAERKIKFLTLDSLILLFVSL